MKTEKTARTDRAAISPTYKIVDIEKLEAAHPQDAVKVFTVKGKAKNIKCDLLIAGGGMGAVAAALSACAAGINVCLTEPTSWLGGQMTAQGVSALDENYLVETSGATRRYKELRLSIRDYYLALGAQSGKARFSEYLDPGNCWVSRLAFEPKVAVKMLSNALSPFVENGNLQIFARTAPLRVKTSGGRIKAVQCVDLDTGKILEFRCRFCIDATEFGDLLPLTGLAYASGAESRLETKEDHAPEKANPDNVQDFTYPFVVEYCPGENHVIEKPPHYDEFLQQGKFSLAGFAMFETSKTVAAAGSRLEYLPFWEYRRLIDHANFPENVFVHDLALINWDSNDLRCQNIIDKPPAVVAERLALAKFLSMGFLYWLQTEAARDDGSGKGYPELKLRSDITGTQDGVSKYPYIRESRRLKAVRTLVESDITADTNPGCRARLFKDSLGIGLYPVDIHGVQDVPGAARPTRPFQIPAAALVQKQLRNFLPACKNIGTTHVSNGAYRLHPIEWAIGEAAGTYAAEALARHTDIVRLLKNKRALRRLQDRLVNAGAPVFWFDDISPEDADFAAIQYVSVCALMAFDRNVLSFRPEEPLARLELAQSLARLLRLASGSAGVSIKDFSPADPGYTEATAAVAGGLILLSAGQNFQRQQSVSLAEMQALSHHKLIRHDRDLPQSDPVSRRDFARWLYSLSRQQRFLGRY